MLRRYGFVKQLLELYYTIYQKEPFGPLLAPQGGLRAPEVSGVNPGGRPQESGDDSKTI